MSLISVISTLVCMVICMRCATTFLLHNAALFTALALFALTWGLVLTYYTSATPAPEWLSAFGAFLTVYSAAIVVRSVKGTNSKVSAVEWCSLWLLGLVITGLSVPFLHIPPERTSVLVATCLYAIGDIAIAWAIYRIARRWVFYSIVPLFLLYFGFEIQYAYRYWTLGAHQAMTPTMPLAFGVCKILVTIGYVTPVVVSGLSSSDSELRWWQLILVFAGFPRETVKHASE